MVCERPLPHGARDVADRAADRCGSTLLSGSEYCLGRQGIALHHDAGRHMYSHIHGVVRICHMQSRARRGGVATRVRGRVRARAGHVADTMGKQSLTTRCWSARSPCHRSCRTPREGRPRRKFPSPSDGRWSFKPRRRRHATACSSITCCHRRPCDVQVRVMV